MFTMLTQGSVGHYLPPFVPHTWMKADVVQETGVNEGQGQIWHPTQLNQTIYL